MNFRAVTRHDWLAILTLIALCLFSSGGSTRLIPRIASQSIRVIFQPVLQLWRLSGAAFDSGTLPAVEPLQLRWYAVLADRRHGSPTLFDGCSSRCIPATAGLCSAGSRSHAAFPADQFAHVCAGPAITKETIGGLIAAIAYTYGAT